MEDFYAFATLDIWEKKVSPLQQLVKISMNVVVSRHLVGKIKIAWIGRVALNALVNQVLPAKQTSVRRLFVKRLTSAILTHVKMKILIKTVSIKVPVILSALAARVFQDHQIVMASRSAKI